MQELYRRIGYVSFIMGNKLFLRPCTHLRLVVGILCGLNTLL